MGRAHAATPAAHSATPLPLAPPHGTFAHVLGAPAGERRKEIHIVFMASAPQVAVGDGLGSTACAGSPIIPRKGTVAATISSRCGVEE